MYIRDYFKDVTWTELSMRGNFLVHEILRSWHKHGRKNRCIWEIKLLYSLTTMFLKVISDIFVCGCKTASTFTKKCMIPMFLFTKLPSLLASD